MLGALPFWLFNLQTAGSTFGFVFEGTRGQTADRGEVLSAWWSADLPRGAGLWHPWGPSPAELGWLMALAIVAALAWAIVGRRGPRLRPLDSVLVLLLVIPTVLVFSGFGGPALNPYGFDATGRYTPPIWSALAVVLGAALAAVWQLRPWLAALLALVPLGVNLAGVVAIEPLQAFQSPYWSKLPADNGPLLAALRAEGVDPRVAEPLGESAAHVRRPGGRPAAGRLRLVRRAGRRHRPLPRVPAAARACGAAGLRAGYQRRGAGAGASAAGPGRRRTLRSECRRTS